jgi:hypothetical protein
MQEAQASQLAANPAPFAVAILATGGNPSDGFLVQVEGQAQRFVAFSAGGEDKFLARPQRGFSQHADRRVPQLPCGAVKESRAREG